MTTAATPTYEYDEDFQRTLAALVLRDADFVARTEGLVLPEYMSSHIDGVLVNIVKPYFDKYRICPSMKMLPTLIKDGIDRKVIRKDDLPDLVARIKELSVEDLTDREFIMGEVARFARRQAMEAAIFKCAELVDKGRIDDTEQVMKEALCVGLAEDTNRVDYFGTIDSRSHIREEILAGRIKPNGITTGHSAIDNVLYQKGWGRKELSVIMGPAKSGKSMSLVGFAAAAAKAGFNVAIFSLEVSNEILADRLDAHLSSTKMNELATSIGVVSTRVSRIAAAGTGLLDLYEFPTGTLSPGDVRRICAKRANTKEAYDMVVVDYADLMRPDRHSDETRENSRLIYVGLRAIAVEFNLAMVSATQTNREGFSASAGKMEHVSEDINKARTVDLLLSLNATPDEKLRGEARIYLAGSRNQASDIAVSVKTEIGKATYIAAVTGVS